MRNFSRSCKYSNFLQTSKRDAIKHGTAWLYIYISTQAYMVEWLWLLVLRRTPMMLEGPLTRLEFPRSWPDFDTLVRHWCLLMMVDDAVAIAGTIATILLYHLSMGRSYGTSDNLVKTKHHSAVNLICSFSMGWSMGPVVLTSLLCYALKNWKDASR